MKKFFLLITLIACLVSGDALSFAQESGSVVVELRTTRKISSPKGKRIPSAPILCVVDFESGQFHVDNYLCISSYELWNEEGESLIVAYPEDERMVEFMSGLQGTYQLRLVAEECLYVGYVEL